MYRYFLLAKQKANDSLIQMILFLFQNAGIQIQMEDQIHSNLKNQISFSGYDELQVKSMWTQLQPILLSDKAEKDNEVQEAILNETSIEKVKESIKPFVEMLDKDEVENNEHLQHLSSLFASDIS